MNLIDMLGNSDLPQDPRSATTTEPGERLCSRKACRQGATMQLLWNNPKIHTPERRKIWLACDEHVAWLEDYLQSRSLWKETLPLTPKDSA